ncbi:hypothetical protein ACWENO_14680 [Streptomyces sp. NPDC004436]
MLINDEATRQVAETIGTALGVGFTLRNAAIANGAAHIEYPDGRTLGFRPIFGGAIVQLWIIGNAKPAGEGEPPTLALLEGHLYHAAVSLIDAEDADPADLILEKLTADLLPAFDFKPHYVGHRPWEDAFSRELAAAVAEPHAETASAPTQEPALHADQEPEPGPVRGPEPMPTTEPAPDSDGQSEPEPSPATKADDPIEPRKQAPAGRKPRRRRAVPAEQ